MCMCVCACAPHGGGGARGWGDGHTDTQTHLLDSFVGSDNAALNLSYFRGLRVDLVDVFIQLVEHVILFLALVLQQLAHLHVKKRRKPGAFGERGGRTELAENPRGSP